MFIPRLCLLALAVLLVAPATASPAAAPAPSPDVQVVAGTLNPDTGMVEYVLRPFQPTGTAGATTYECSVLAPFQKPCATSGVIDATSIELRLSVFPGFFGETVHAGGTLTYSWEWRCFVPLGVGLAFCTFDSEGMYTRAQSFWMEGSVSMPFVPFYDPPGVGYAKFKVVA